MTTAGDVQQYPEAYYAKVDPANPLTRSNRGKVLEELDKFADPVEEWKVALEIDPLYADVQYDLTRAYGRDGHSPDALRIAGPRTSRWTQANGRTGRAKNAGTTPERTA
jgi:tetratricopeptide (TPR) repeat protein